MQGSLDTPTIHLGGRRPNVALSEKIEHLCHYGGWMHSAASRVCISWPNEGWDRFPSLSRKEHHAADHQRQTQAHHGARTV
jgi:hypothetical protein